MTRRISSLAFAMADSLAEAAADAVMPRYQRLAKGDVEEKSPGELVTIADHEAEAIIAARLKSLRPEARFVGEEACARDPSLLRDLDQGEVWIVDPIDGTRNFAEGRGPFALMAALIRRGEIVASCVLNPLNGALVAAERGAGAWIDGERITTGAGACDVSACTGIISHFQRPAAMESQVARLADRVAQVQPTRRCAGAEYPIVAQGVCDFALYWRTLVWDHAPGVLILEEAGGKAARLDGARYCPTDPSGAILLAHSDEIWDQAASTLAG